MKLGIFKNVTRSIAFGLLSTTMLCGGVWGDVFELKEDTADEPRPIQCQTANEFIRFVRENLNDLPNIAINPFERINAKWQMLGYAVFFPTGSTALQQVYVAQKREGKAPNNNARNGGNITDVNNFSHTERQLVWSVLDEYANPAVLTAGMQGRPYASYGNLTGTLHIYTTESPCDAKLKGEVMSCQQFYNDLLCFLPNIKIEIYFHTPKLRKQLFSEGGLSTCFMKSKLQMATRKLLGGAGLNNLRISGGGLIEFNSNNSQWMKVDDRNFGDFVDAVDAALRASAPAQISNFFNDLFGIHGQLHFNAI